MYRQVYQISDQGRCFAGGFFGGTGLLVSFLATKISGQESDSRIGYKNIRFLHLSLPGIPQSEKPE
jgi:hypothetical protein